MPLADCVRECPSHEQEGSPEFLDELLESAMREVNNLDAKFLESLGVEPI